MAEIVNLRRARKVQKRAEEAASAAANRVRFGRTKAEKSAERAASERAQREQDGKQIE